MNESKSKSNPDIVANELSPEVIARAVEQLMKLVDAAKPAIATTAARDRNRALKFPRGGETVLPVLVNAVAQHAIAQPVAPMSSAMEQRMQYAQLVKPAAALAKQLAELLGDAERQAETDTWQIATTVYTFLRRVAVADPGVKTSIADAVAFFKTGPRVPGGKPRKSRAKNAQPAAPAQAGATPVATAANGAHA